MFNSILIIQYKSPIFLGRRVFQRYAGFAILFRISVEVIMVNSA